MSAILDQIKRNAVPAAVLRTASKGALPLPGSEMIEILVYLTHNPIFAQDARMTLAGWDLKSAIEALGHADAPPEVVGYYWSEQNRRPALMPTLIENPGVTDNMLMELAGEAPREIISMLLASPRVHHLPGVIEALSTNPRVLPAELQALHGGPPLQSSVEQTLEQAEEVSGDTSAMSESDPAASDPQPESFPEFPVVPPNQFPEAVITQTTEAHPQPAGSPASADADTETEPVTVYDEEDPETAAIRLEWEKKYAAEIAAAEAEPFELISAEEDPAESLDGQTAAVAESAAQETVAAESESAVAADAATPDASNPATAIAALSLRSKADAINARKLTVMQRLNKMKAADRIKTAFIGGKEERAFLIRDRARIIQNAVLASPKLTDAEVEIFAAARNLDENVLREIARNRRFMKNYPVVRNLATNAKTPLDVALPLVKMLMVFDLKQLQRSKSVSETIRKMAQKYYQEKATSGGKTKT